MLLADCHPLGNIEGTADWSTCRYFESVMKKALWDRPDLNQNPYVIFSLFIQMLIFQCKRIVRHLVLLATSYLCVHPILRWRSCSFYMLAFWWKDGVSMVISLQPLKMSWLHISAHVLLYSNSRKHSWSGCAQVLRVSFSHFLCPCCQFWFFVIPIAPGRTWMFGDGKRRLYRLRLVGACLNECPLKLCIQRASSRISAKTCLIPCAGKISASERTSLETNSQCCLYVLSSFDHL